MKYYEKLDYQLSRRFKESIGLEFLENKLNKSPYNVFKIIRFKDTNYEDFLQGDKLRYEINDDTGDIDVFLETISDLKKKFILFQIKKRGNEVDIVTRSPREDTNVFHIRHNYDGTVQMLNKRIKFYNREDEQLLESRYALFSDSGDLLDYNEQKFDSYSINLKDKFYKI